jgi:release factor glutamine methyltransferase
LRTLEAVRETARELAAAGVPSPRNDAEILVAEVVACSRSALYADDRSLGEGELDRLRSLVARRRKREPLAYILGEWGFRRLTLAVDDRVLIPRPETEIVVERCLELLQAVAEPRVLDVGVGSGAIALALADEHPTAQVVATDASHDALALARENRERAGLDGRVELVPGALFADVAGPFHLVVSNPPYVKAGELETLQPEILHEPRAALLESGMTEAVAEGARDVLRPHGWLVLECGNGQADAVAAVLRSLGYESVRTTADLAGRERVVEGRLP